MAPKTGADGNVPDPSLRRAALYAIGLRAVYVVAALLARGHLLADPRLIRSNDFTEHLISPERPLAWALLGAWERFDALWYLHLAQMGYDRQAAVVFYPLYPALIRMASWVFHPPLASALAISTAAAFCFAWGLQKLIRLDLPDRTAARAILLLAVWPGSFILFAGYADSLVMALSVWSVYFARTERWRLAGILGLFAGSTKAVGAVVAVPLAWLAWRKNPRRLWVAVLPLCGPAAFSLWIRSAGYGAQTAAYAAHWHTRPAWPWNTLAASVRAFFATPPNLILQLNLVFLSLACGLMLVRKLRTEYRLYALASLTLFLTKSTDPLLQSTMRYVLAVFPSFIALAIVLDKRQAGLAAVLAFLALLNGVVLFEFWQWSLLV